MSVRFLSGVNIDSNTLFVDDANNRVGIGTASPTSQLHVQSSAPELLLYNTTTAGGTLNFVDQAWQSQIVGIQGNLLLKTGGTTERVRITNDGNVGIGTTAPTETLDLRGVLRVSRSGVNDSGIIAFGNYANGAGYYDNGIFRSSLNAITTSGNVLHMGSYEALAFTASANPLGSQTIRMYISGTSGNVGIGTTAPADRLYVGNSAGTSISISTNQAAGFIASPLNLDLNFRGYADTKMAMIRSWDESANTGVGYLTFWTNNSGNVFTEKMRITPEGNVGIGTTSPGAPLEVNSSGGLPIIRARYNATYYTDFDSNGIDFRGASQTFDIKDNGSSAIRIASGGNVGIGTTSPAAKFQVTDASSSITLQNYLNGAAIFLDGVNGDFIGGDYFHILADGSSYLGVGGYAGGATPLNVSNAGNVGIGTTAPTSPLHISSSTNKTITLDYTAGSGSYSWASFRQSGTEQFRIWGSYSDGYLSFYNDQVPAHQLTLASSGNVGIGTTAPGAKLEIAQNTDNTDGPTLRIANNANTLSNGQLIGAIDFYNGDDSGTGNAVGAFIRSFTADAVLPVSSQYLSFAAGGTTERMRIASTGATRLNAYGSGSFTGTVAYNLAVDSSGNIIETAGGVVDGSGTASYVSKWSDANTLTNSLLYDNGSTISIGLGSTTPSYTNAYGYPQFAIESNAFASSHVFTHNDTNGNYSFFALGKSKGTAAAPTIVENSETIGDFQFWAYDGAAYRNTAFIRNQIDGEPGAGDVPGRLVFGTTNDGSSSASEKMRITAAGNVGIGTTSPAATLDIVSSGSIQTSILARGLDANFRLVSRQDKSSNDSGAIVGEFGVDWTTTRNSAIRFHRGGDVTGGFMTFTTNDGSERMRITAAGNVGIGTTAPDAKLVIVTGSTDDSGNSFSFTGYGSKEYVSISKLGFIRSRASDLNGANMHFIDNGGTNRMEMAVNTTSMNWYSHALGSTFMVFQHTTGNVGIGTTSPGFKLTLAAASATDADILLAGMTGVSNGFTVRRVSSSFVYSMIDGGLGINNTAPTQALHVTGNARVTGAYYDSNNSAGSSGQVLSSTGSGTDWVSLSEITGVDGTGTANYIAKWSDTDTITNSQVFDNGTNVGINNASPKTKLDVNGAIGFGSKTLNISDTFVTVLTVNMSNHTGCYVKITAFGDWNGHSAVAYLGEFFLQNGASAYNEPGVIIRQVDNTNTDDIVAQIVDPAGTGTRDFEIQLKTTSASGVPFSAAIQYEVRGQYNSVS